VVLEAVLALEAVPEVERRLGLLALERELELVLIPTLELELELELVLIPTLAPDPVLEVALEPTQAVLKNLLLRPRVQLQRNQRQLKRPMLLNLKPRRKRRLSLRLKNPPRRRRRSLKLRPVTSSKRIVVVSLVRRSKSDTFPLSAKKKSSITLRRLVGRPRLSHLMG
jgi:hypothetical protein